MKKKWGFTDKARHFILAIIVGVMYYADVLTILGALAIAAILASFTGFCPLYFPFGINTRKTINENSKSN